MLGDFVVRDRLDIPWGGFPIPHGPSVIGMIQDISKSPEEGCSRHINQRLYRPGSLRLPQTLKRATRTRSNLKVSGVTDAKKTHMAVARTMRNLMASGGWVCRLR